MVNNKVLLLFVFIILIYYGEALGILYCDTPVIDFGEVQEGEIVSKVFIIRNTTNKSVFLSRVMTSCACVTGGKKSYDIEPGDKIEIPIKFDTRGRGGNVIRKNIFLFVGNENKLDLKLSIVGTIKGKSLQESIEVIPSEKHIFNDISKWHKITVKGPAKDNFEISVNGPEWLDVKMSPPQQYPELQINHWDLTFSLNKKFDNNRKGEIVITTNLPSYEKLTIPIYVESKPTINVSPPVLFIKAQEPNETCIKELQLTVLNDSIDTNPKEENNSPKHQDNIKKESLVERPKLISSNNKDTLPIVIEPSDDCITVKLLTISPDSSQIKYEIEINIQDCPSSRLHLNIMDDDICIRKVPIIISKEF